MHDKLKKLIATLAIVIVATFAVQTPAQASSSDCYAQTICLFAHSNFGNPIWRQYADQINGCRPLTGFNDITSHVWNRAGGVLVTLYWHGDCTGASFNLASGTYADLGPTDWNDELSGIRVTLF